MGSELNLLHLYSDNVDKVKFSSLPIYILVKLKILPITVSQTFILINYNIKNYRALQIL